MNLKSMSRMLAMASLLATPMLVLAGDDIFQREKDAAQKRYDEARDRCEQFKSESQSTCESTAKANYDRELLVLKKQQQDRQQPSAAVPSNS